MKTLKEWKWIANENNRIDLEIDGRHLLQLFILEQDIIRVLLRRHSEFRFSRTWSIAPNYRSEDEAQGVKDVDWHGRDRLDTEGFSMPDYDIEESTDEMSLDEIKVSTTKLRITIRQPLCLDWEYKDTHHRTAWRALASDRKTGAYMLGVHQPHLSHFMDRSENECYFGLGEKSGKLNRHGKRYEMRNLDAMGYDAEHTDPLYKHIPFYITSKLLKDTNDRINYGLFYDNLSCCRFDLGNELDNYHAPYRSYRAEDGDLDYYLILGPRVADVTKRFSRLIGGSALPPKWSLGYCGSSMQYTEPKDAEDRVLDFIDQCHRHDMPCDSFQLSSGYTSIGTRRYVFRWNREKFPNPQRFTEECHKTGVKLVANIKPCLLRDHPDYTDAADKGLFIQDSEFEQPENSVFWDDEGSHLDFTNPDAINWWKARVRQELLEKGIAATWNDNNEYEVWDGDARCFGFGREIPVRLIRPLQALLMTRASFDAQTAFFPDTRPFLVTRSGCPGINRYAQTWTGDNKTDWKTLRYNNYMGLGLSLSGIYNFGHDVGGFAGPPPDSELFIRWVQNGALHPRFTIHSYNDDGSTTEPWMYPEALPEIHEAFRLRYSLLPYLYDLFWKAHNRYEPILRPTFYDFETDPKTFEENDEFMLGESLLVASVVQPGRTVRELYLPKDKECENDGWCDIYSGQWYSGGQVVSLPAPLKQIPVLALAGSVIPTRTPANFKQSKLDKNQDAHRRLLVFPFKGAGRRSFTIFDDDGESYRYKYGSFFEVAVILECDNQRINLTISTCGEWCPAYKWFELVLPSNEPREFWVNKRLRKSHDVFDLMSL